MAIMVDYAEVLAFQGRLGDIYRQIDSELAELSTRVEELTRVWEGAAAEGFWDTVREWQASATDLRERLAQLHDMVGRAHDNQAAVVASNTAFGR